MIKCPNSLSVQCSGAREGQGCCRVTPPGNHSFTVFQRDTHHWDISNEWGRAFRIRGEPGDIWISDERKDCPDSFKEEERQFKGQFKSVSMAMAAIAEELMYPPNGEYQSREDLSAYSHVLNLKELNQDGFVSYLHGREQGELARFKYQLDLLDQIDTKVLVLMPGLSGMSPSFFLGMFKNSVVGYENAMYKFFQKYCFDVDQNIMRQIMSGFKRCEMELEKADV